MDAVALTSKILSQVLDKYLLAHGIPGGGAVVEAVLGDLLQLQDAQAEALARVDRNVQRLIDGPWRQAHLLIEEASLPGRSPELRAKALDEAVSQLRKAISLQDPRTFAYSYVCLNLAVILRILGDPEASTFYSRLAMQAATDFMLDVRDKKVLPPSGSGRPSATRSILGALLLPAGIVFTDRQAQRTSRSWSDDVRQQFDAIHRATALLCGPNDIELIRLRTRINS